MKSSSASTLDRRKFLQGLGGSGILGSGLVGSMSSLLGSTGDPDPDGPIVVLLHLAGGNDVLNTVVPVDTSESVHYYEGRLELALDAEDVLPIQDGYGFHPALEQFKGLWDSGDLAIVNGVGNPNQGLSHFRSIDIWESAKPSASTESGWMGRYFQHRCSEDGAFDPMIGVDVREAASLAYRTPQNETVLTVANPEYFKYLSKESKLPSSSDFDTIFMKGMASDLVSRGGSDGNVLQYVTASLQSALSSSDTIQGSISTEGDVPDESVFPETQLGRDLGNIAKYIASGMTTSTYFATHGGYDTHSDQVRLDDLGKPFGGRHAVLLTQLNDAMGAFSAELKRAGVWERVIVVTYSEFSRKIVQNGNHGTDHGAAGSVFVAGGGVQKGFYGAFPSLAPENRILNNSMPVTTDFRQVYRTILERWLEVDGAIASEILQIPENEFSPLDFLPK